MAELAEYKILSKYAQSTHLIQIASERALRYAQMRCPSAKIIMIFYL